MVKGYYYCISVAEHFASAHGTPVLSRSIVRDPQPYLTDFTSKTVLYMKALVTLNIN